MTRLHEDQLDVSPALVEALITAQFPHWRDRPIRPVPQTGTVNALFRLGDDLVARLPLRPGDPALVRRGFEREAAAARELAAHVPVAVPEPVALGAPGAGFPLPWAVQTWLLGETAFDLELGDAFAVDLAACIAAVRAIPAAGRTFTGDNRGGDLRRHDAWVQRCLAESAGLVDVDGLARVWATLRGLPREDPDAMTHGDLTAGNVLVAGGRLAGVLDVGEYGAADPALDLVAAWHLLDDGPRARLRAHLDVGDLQWARGQAWALEQALGLGWYYRDSNPAMSRMGVRTLERLLVNLV